VWRRRSWPSSRALRVWRRGRGPHPRMRRILAASGVAGAAAHLLWPIPEPSASLESRCVRSGQLEVHILGVEHGSPAAVDFVRRGLEQARSRGQLVAVALETDDDTLKYMRAATAAVAGLTPQAISQDGEFLIREALHKLQGPGGEGPGEAQRVRLPSELSQALRRGCVYGQEMAAAADFAETQGVALRCIDLDPRAKRQLLVGSGAGPAPWPAWLDHVRAHMRLKWLQTVHLRAPSLAEHLEVMARVSPALFEASIHARDKHMAQQVHSLLLQARSARPKARVAPEEVARVVVVVGLAHVPGLEKLLASRLPSLPPGPEAQA